MKRTVASMVAVLVGCGSHERTTAPARPAPPVQVAPIQPEPPAPPSPPPPAAPTPSPWYRQIVDYEVFDSVSSLFAFARADGVALLTVAGSMSSSDWARHDAHGWLRTSASPGIVIGAAFDAAGAPWVLSEEDDELRLRHGTSVETIRDHFRPEWGDRGALTLDDDGKPHVCITTEQAITSDQPPGLVVSYAAPHKGRWAIEKLPVQGDGCTIAVTRDGRVVIGTREGVAVHPAGGSWRSEPLGGPTIVARGPDGAVVAATRAARTVSIARMGDAGWTRATLVADAGDRVRSLALAIDASGRAHVALDTADNHSRGKIAYAVEGTTDLSVIAEADARGGLALALDASGAPHVAYAPGATPDPTNATVVYARRREPADPPTAIGHDVAGMIGACARLVDAELGAEPALTTAEERRHRRLCGMLAAEPDQGLAQRCSDGDLDACLVGGARVNARPRTLTVLDLTYQPCAVREPDTSCASRATRAVSLANNLDKIPPDEALATRLFARACELGHAPACMFGAWEGEVGFADLAKLCSPTLPIACAAALGRMPRPSTAQLAAIRATLETACKTSRSTTACTDLAYMKEASLGGRASKAEAVQHLSHACALDSTTSCVRLLIGPLGRPPVPKGLDPTQLAASLDAACTSGDGDACVAEAAAYDRGWAVPRDRARAKALLVQACDEAHHDAACKQLGRR